METHPNHTPLHHPHSPDHTSRSNVSRHPGLDPGSSSSNAFRFSLLVLALVAAFIGWTIFQSSGIKTSEVTVSNEKTSEVNNPGSRIKDPGSKIQTQAAEPALILNLRTGEIEAKKIMLKDMDLADEIERLKKEIEELKRNR